VNTAILLLFPKIHTSASIAQTWKTAFIAIFHAITQTAQTLCFVIIVAFVLTAQTVSAVTIPTTWNGRKGARTALIAIMENL
jgi:hypothetical protein